MMIECADRRAAWAAAALAGAMLALSACAPAGIAVGAAASTGVAASEERGLGGTVSDTVIRFKINDLWLKDDFNTFSRLNLQIYEGRVLVSGRTPDQEKADRAIQLAWQSEGVREVINEIEISEPGGIEEFTQDTWINAHLDADLLFDQKVNSVNYSTRSVAGTVYLLGVAQDREELDRVFRIARDVPSVKRVISHVILKDDPRRASPEDDKAAGSKSEASR